MQYTNYLSIEVADRNAQYALEATIADAKQLQLLQQALEAESGDSKPNDKFKAQFQSYAKKAAEFIKKIPQRVIAFITSIIARAGELVAGFGNMLSAKNVKVPAELGQSFDEILDGADVMTLNICNYIKDMSSYVHQINFKTTVFGETAGIAQWLDERRSENEKMKANLEELGNKNILKNKSVEEYMQEHQEESNWTYSINPRERQMKITTLRSKWIGARTSLEMTTRSLANAFDMQKRMADDQTEEGRKTIGSIDYTIGLYNKAYSGAMQRASVMISLLSWLQKFLTCLRNFAKHYAERGSVVDSDYKDYTVTDPKQTAQDRANARKAARDDRNFARDQAKRYQKETGKGSRALAIYGGA